MRSSITLLVVPLCFSRFSLTYTTSLNFFTANNKHISLEGYGTWTSPYIFWTKKCICQAIETNLTTVRTGIPKCPESSSIANNFLDGPRSCPDKSPNARHPTNFSCSKHLICYQLFWITRSLPDH